MINVTPVILCGGYGTRLWALSREGFPKQFLVLSVTTGLFQQAVERVAKVGASDILVADTLVATHEDHRFLLLRQLHEIKYINTTLMLKPIGRNTAPARSLAALQAAENGQDPIWWSHPPIKSCKTIQRSSRRYSKPTDTTRT